MTAQVRVHADEVDEPAPARGSGLARTSCVLGLILGPWGFVVTNTAYMLAIRDGGNENTGADTLALYAAHPSLVRLAVAGGLFACMLIVPAVLGVFRLVPHSRLVRIGGGLMIAGYICYFAIVQGSLTTLGLALSTGSPDELGRALDAGQGEPIGIAVFATFAAGNLIGTLLLAIGLLLSREVPVMAAIGIGLWPILHVIGLVFFGNEVPQVIGAVLQALGFGVLGVVLARRGV